MRRRIWLVLLTVLLLSLCSIAAAETETVVMDGVIYELDGENATMTGFVEGQISVSIHAEVKGLPTRGWEAEEDDDFEPVQAAPEEIIFMEGITSLLPYHTALASARRISLPSSYHPEEEARTIWAYQSFFMDAHHLEILRLPKETTKADLAILAGWAADVYEGSPYDILYSEFYDLPVDPSRNRSLHSIQIAPGNPTLYDVGGIVYEKETNLLLTCPPGREGAVIVPEGTTGIGDKAFLHCDRVESVSLPRSVTRIGNAAFLNCGSLRTVWLPPTLEKIAPRAFSNCVSLASIIIPDGTTVEAQAFEYCASLQQAYLLGSGSTIDPAAFAKCPRNLTLYAKEGSPGWAAAIRGGLLWAEPGGEPVKLVSPDRIHRQPAYVHAGDETASVPLYAGPSASDGVIAQLAVGDTVDILETHGNWARISSYHAKGFLPLDCLALFSLDAPYERIYCVLLDKDPFPLYKAPSREAAFIVGEQYNRYPVIEQFGAWFLIDDEGVPRYVHVADCYVYGMNFGNPPMWVVACSDLETRVLIYAEPSEESAVIGAAYPGMQLTVLESKAEEGGLAHVAVNGVNGYSMSGYIESDDLRRIDDEWFYEGW